MQIRTMTLPGAQKKKWTLKYLEHFFSTAECLRRYDWHLIKMSTRHRQQIWDISHEAMETLLVLNTNLHASKNTAQHDILAYRAHKSHKMILHQLEKGTDMMPVEWFFGQLRFNLTRPYVTELYTRKKRELANRYDLIRQFMEQYYTPGSDNVGLETKPGSATSDYAQHWISSVIHKEYHKAEFSIDLPRDWYCHWLLPMLRDDDEYARKLKLTLSGDDGTELIYRAIMPYVHFQDNQRGFCLFVKADVAPGGRLSTSLQLESWPKGKPVLYCCCENNYIPMIKFCLHGLSPEAKTMKLNTPRRKPMKAKEPSHMSDAEYNSERIPGGSVQVENYPLHIAAWHGHIDTVKYLCENGANHTLKNYWGETPAETAAMALRLDVPRTDPARNRNCKKIIAWLNEIWPKTAAYKSMYGGRKNDYLT